jgi:thioredoxin-like negative regulator of GroEL
MTFNEIYSLSEFEKTLDQNQAALFYFSASHCSVCKVLKPKLNQMIENDYPEIHLFYIDIEKYPQIAGQMRIFTIPTLLIYFEGKEFYRISRNISLEALKTTIERPYHMLF